MQKILVVGSGKIGSLIAVLLSNTQDYQVYLADINIDSSLLKNLALNKTNLELIQLDAENLRQMTDFLKKNSVQGIVSSLPYRCNIAIANLAKEFNLNYFDLTEDINVAATVAKLSQNAKTHAFIPQCGLAPGFISIVANHLMKHFDTLDTVKMRVGALPLNISNALQYSLTWSTDGLINEYGNLCLAISNGEEVKLRPLDDIEEIKIDGLTYEAFNTSGGIGTLAHSYKGKIKHLTYKTMRYPGHCDKMRFLMNDLNLNEDRDTLKQILERAIPKTQQDVVLVYVSVTGQKNKQFIEENYVKKFYPKKINGIIWSAIQMTTASALCAVLDITLQSTQKFQGLIKQEEFSLEEFINNRFGSYYAEGDLNAKKFDAIKNIKEPEIIE